MDQFGVGRGAWVAVMVLLMLLALYGGTFVEGFTSESVRWDDNVGNVGLAGLARSVTIVDGTLEIMDYHAVPIVTAEWTAAQKQAAKRRVESTPGYWRIGTRGWTNIQGAAPRWRRFGSWQYAVKPHYFSMSPLTSAEWDVVLKGQMVHFFDVPLWPAAAACAVVVGWLLFPVLRVRSRAARGRCVRCGYDRRWTPGRCPECGCRVPVRASVRRDSAH